MDITFLLRKRASLVDQTIKNLPAMWETWAQSLGWEDPLEKGTVTHSVFWPGECHGQRSLEGYSPWGCKQTRLSDSLHSWGGIYHYLWNSLARKSNQFKSNQSTGFNSQFTENTGMEEYIKQCHMEAISKIQTVGNSTGKTTVSSINKLQRKKK